MDIPPKLYVVLRRESGYSDEWPYSARDMLVNAFTNREKAEQYRCEWERTNREGWINGWPSDEDGGTFGNLQNFTSLPVIEFVSRIRSLGLPDFPALPMEDGSSSYETDFCHIEFKNQKWWANARETLSAEQFDELWAIFDCLHSFYIVEVETSSLRLSLSCEDDIEEVWCEWSELNLD